MPFTPEFEKELMQADENEPIHFPEILRPEARPMLEQLRAMGLQLALASSSPMSNIRQVLGECGLMEFFPVIVSGEQFEASKPDPEIYLHTMARLGPPPGGMPYRGRLHLRCAGGRGRRGPCGRPAGRALPL